MKGKKKYIYTKFTMSILFITNWKELFVWFKSVDGYKSNYTISHFDFVAIYYNSFQENAWTKQAWCNK